MADLPFKRVEEPHAERWGCLSVYLKMQYPIIIIGTLLMTACCDNVQRQQSLAAQQSAERTRENWDKVQRPFAIHIEWLSEKEAGTLKQIGVYARLRDATPDEQGALYGVTFDLKEGCYLAAARNAVTTDTMAPLFVCYPYHKGLGGADTIRLKAPFSENLYGRETERTFNRAVDVRMNLQSAMAQLRIICGSNDVQDRLGTLGILGDGIYTEAGYMPYTGRWTDRKADGVIHAPQADCLLNNGREHTLYLVPTETAGTVTLLAKINGKSHALKTTLPPLRAGSLTQLNLYKSQQGLSVSSSWVDSNRPLTTGQMQTDTDTVKIGQFLQKGGYISNRRDSNSVAIIIQTDGRHGKAVALKDCEGRYLFSGSPLSSGKIFATIDGKRKEGVVNPKLTQDVGEAEKIIFKPDIPYGANCALGYGNGAELTHLLMERAESRMIGQVKSPSEQGIVQSRKSMLAEIQRHPGSYVPSLREMTALYCLLNAPGRNPLVGKMEILLGEYLTSSEASNETFYLMELENGIITGTLSKQYARMQLRLFYLF